MVLWLFLFVCLGMLSNESRKVLLLHLDANSAIPYFEGLDPFVSSFSSCDEL